MPHSRKLAFLLTAAIATTACAASPCTVKPKDYFGWKAQSVSNQWVELTIVPQLGGRLMQVKFGDHEYLFVNDALKGQYMPPDTENHRWFNYGGDKVWPMPEGNKDEQHWPGAGGSALDDMPYAFEALSRGATCKVRLTGPVDSFTGQQYIREISLSDSSPAISFHAVMKNASGYPRAWSEQSVSQYNTADPGDPTKVNPSIWGVTLANPQSSFLNGYHVRTGTISDQAYSVDDNGLFKVHPLRSGGEVWIDSRGGWLAVADGATDFTMVERNHFDPNAEYPDKTTMIFFTTGGSRNRPNSNAAPAANPNPPVAATPGPKPIIYMEAEVNSPVVELQPGESYAMDTTWYPTRGGETLRSVTYSGVVESALAAKMSESGIQLTGKFGVLYPGDVVAICYSRGGEILGTEHVAVADPLQLIDLNATIPVINGTTRVTLHLIDTGKVDRGPLGEAMVEGAPAEQGR